MRSSGKGGGRRRRQLGPLTAEVAMDAVRQRQVNFERRKIMEAASQQCKADLMDRPGGYTEYEQYPGSEARGSPAGRHNHSHSDLGDVYGATGSGMGSPQAPVSISAAGLRPRCRIHRSGSIDVSFEPAAGTATDEFAASRLDASMRGGLARLGGLGGLGGLGRGIGGGPESPSHMSREIRTILDGSPQVQMQQQQLQLQLTQSGGGGGGGSGASSVGRLRSTFLSVLEALQGLLHADHLGLFIVDEGALAFAVGRLKGSCLARDLTPS